MFENSSDINKHSPIRKRSFLHSSEDTGEREVSLFSHLNSPNIFNEELIHWAVREYGLKVKERKIQGGNQRCQEMLKAIGIFVDEYSHKGGRGMKRDLELKLQQIEEYISSQRRMSFGMETALMSLKLRLSKIPLTVEVSILKKWLKDTINTFINDKIQSPVDIIGQSASEIIKDDEVILTYGFSTSVANALLKAKQQEKDFSVIVADSRPYLPGQKLLIKLLQNGIRCKYIHINSVSYHMNEVSRIFLGASGITANGYLLNCSGTGMICCIADRFKKPVIVCAETYKFSDRVQIDSICYNELWDPDVIQNTQMYEGDTRVKTLIDDWRSEGNLLILNTIYDLTPAQYIGMLVTEVGCVPVTSVPVILREYRKDIDNVDVAAEIAEYD